MTPEQLAVFAGAALSLIFAYFPWVKDWFEGLDSTWKPLANAGFLLVVALVLVGVGCLDLVDYFACSTAGLQEAVILWVYALIGNYFTYVTGVRQFKQR